MLGRLEAVPSLHKIAVTPYVCLIESQCFEAETVQYSEREIDKVFTVPISELVRPEALSFDIASHRSFKTPRFRVAGFDDIWGLTGYLCFRVLEEMGRSLPRC